jgi:hypothetical protein
MSTFYRKVGMSYIQYAEKCATLVRSVIKPEFAPNVTKRGFYNYKVFQFKEGVQQPGGKLVLKRLCDFKWCVYS